MKDVKTSWVVLRICDVLTTWEEKEVAQNPVPLGRAGSHKSSDRKHWLKVLYTMRCLSVSPKIKSKCRAAPDGLIQLLNPCVCFPLFYHLGTVDLGSSGGFKKVPQCWNHHQLHSSLFPGSPSRPLSSAEREHSQDFLHTVVTGAMSHTCVQRCLGSRNRKMGREVVDPPSLGYLSTQRRRAPRKQDRLYFGEGAKGGTWANYNVFFPLRVALFFFFSHVLFNLNILTWM